MFDVDEFLDDCIRANGEDKPQLAIKELIERAVADLPDGFRSVFVLREIEGMSVEETAQALDIPCATVKTRLHRARSKLQQALAPEVKGALCGSFPFAGADCAALTERVMALLD